MWYSVVRVNSSSVTMQNWNSKKACPVYGNLPKLFKGMALDLSLGEVEPSGCCKVEDFILPLGDSKLGKRNVGIIVKNGIPFENYKRVFDRFLVVKDKGFSWKYAEVDDGSLYKKLPFAEADKLHHELVNDAEDEQRLDKIKQMAISDMRSRGKITYQVMEYLDELDDIERKGAYRRLSAIIKMGLLMDDRFRLNMDRVLQIVDVELERKENFVNKDIVTRNKLFYPMLTREEIDAFKKELDFFAPEQKIVLDCLLDSSPVILTGGAGTGKTSVIKAIIDCYARYYKKSDILLAAPTGKAARRLAEKTGYETSTIHKALRKSQEDDFVYYHNRNKLPYQLIVIDESSMIDTELMYDLLSAAKDEAKIIFAGDSNQLAPVGYGEPFFDFQEVIPVFRLTENHRQGEGTDILRAADEALNGKDITPGRGVYVEDIALDAIGDILSELNDSNTQFVSPRRPLKDLLNKYLKKNKDEMYSVGDKVIFGKNTKEYCNGDMGVVVRKNNFDITVNIEGRTVSVPKTTYKDKNEIDLGYCITVHKMQGSECSRVVMFLQRNNRWDNEQNMLYTAITRAKNEVYIYYYTI